MSIRFILLVTVTALSLALPRRAFGEEARPAEAPPQKDTPAAGAAHDDDEGGVGFGALGGVGFPRPLAVEAFVDLDRVALVGAEYAFLPTTTISGVSLSSWSVAADARVFPFRGAFFVGARLGHQHIDGTATVTVTGVGSASESVALDGWFVNPRVGFLWHTNPGLAVGVAVGLEVPLSTSTSSASPSLPAGLSIDTGLASAAGTFGRSVLPTVDLLQIGFEL